MRREEKRSDSLITFRTYSFSMMQSNKQAKRACPDRLVIDLAHCSLAACCQTQKHSTDDISINCTP